MKQLYLFLLLITSSLLSAQNFLEVDNKVKTYPKRLTANKLADKINTDFSNDIEKVRAVFSWLSFNIRYNLEEFRNPTKRKISFRYRNEAEKLATLQIIKDSIVNKTLLTKAAICEGYAQTFSKICTLLNIQNEVIKGNIRTSSYNIGKTTYTTNHAWNAVKINNRWIHIDVTWAAGTVINGTWKHLFNDYYFDIPLKKYFLSHFPKDKKWRTHNKTISINDYFNQPIYFSNFLKTNYQLISPLTGNIKRNNNGSIEFTLKGIKPNQVISCGFRGYKYAKKPKVIFNKNIAKVSIIPPENSNEISLIIDNMVALQFLID